MRRRLRCLLYGHDWSPNRRIGGNVFCRRCYRAPANPYAHGIKCGGFRP